MKSFSSESKQVSQLQYSTAVLCPKSLLLLSVLLVLPFYCSTVNFFKPSERGGGGRAYSRTRTYLIQEIFTATSENNFKEHKAHTVYKR